MGADSRHEDSLVFREHLGVVPVSMMLGGHLSGLRRLGSGVVSAK